MATFCFFFFFSSYPLFSKSGEKSKLTKITPWSFFGDMKNQGWVLFGGPFSFDFRHHPEYPSLVPMASATPPSTPPSTHRASTTALTRLCGPYFLLWPFPPLSCELHKNKNCLSFISVCPSLRQGHLSWELGMDLVLPRAGEGGRTFLVQGRCLVRAEPVGGSQKCHLGLRGWGDRQSCHLASTI